MQRRVVILGSTGSVGRQALEIIQAHPNHFEVVGLVAGRDADSLAEQARDFPGAETGLGEEAAVRLVALDRADIVLNAIVGAAGLRASLAALSNGKKLALANKESLVAGGELCLAAAERGNGRIVPVDSEHAAIAQCLNPTNRSDVKRIVLTASGGPFRNASDLSSVTPEDALKHPTWSMGPKITVDSATLMNKGFEMIEAHYLFGLPYDSIDVLVHPQSVVHGIVEFKDGSMLMQAAPTDMRIPLQAALSDSEMLDSPVDPLDLSDVSQLTFERVDMQHFPSVQLAERAGRAGQTYPAALNAANEEAVRAFLEREIGFTDIPVVVEEVLDRHDPIDATIEANVFEADNTARRHAREVIGRLRATVTTGLQS
jgi:1-deoxy-D-xylulose-5-phosphate reductoisomerase